MAQQIDYSQDDSLLDSPPRLSRQQRLAQIEQLREAQAVRMHAGWLRHNDNDDHFQPNLHLDLSYLTRHPASSAHSQTRPNRYEEQFEDQEEEPFDEQDDMQAEEQERIQGEEEDEEDDEDQDHLLDIRSDRPIAQGTNHELPDESDDLYQVPEERTAVGSDGERDEDDMDNLDDDEFERLVLRDIGLAREPGYHYGADGERGWCGMKEDYVLRHGPEVIGNPNSELLSFRSPLFSNTHPTATVPIPSDQFLAFTQHTLNTTAPLFSQGPYHASNLVKQISHRAPWAALEDTTRGFKIGVLPLGFSPDMSTR
jgi:hypothetical protein